MASGGRPLRRRRAHAFTDAVSGKTSKATPLTNRKATAARAEVKRRKAAQARERAEQVDVQHRAALPVRRPTAPAPEKAAAALARCLTCSGQLDRPRHVRCPECWERQGGAQPREARKRRGRSIAAARSELDEWRAQHPHANADPTAFAPIRAGLSGVNLPASWWPPGAAIRPPPGGVRAATSPRSPAGLPSPSSPGCR